MTPTHTTTSTASAIDLAGSEDNRRTDNNRERLVESSSINKSLFVLAQCVEAISKKQLRIPYRESKMTRILSLGQNNGLTIMILNLSPVRAFHLDSLSTLQVANRTKKIEVREVENEPVFRGPAKQTSLLSGSSLHRQPLRPLQAAANIGLSTFPARDKPDKPEKPAKSFSVYAEKDRLSSTRASTSSHSSNKRPSDSDTYTLSSRPIKALKPLTSSSHTHRPATNTSNVSHQSITDLVNRLVDEKLASKTLSAPEPSQSSIPENVRARLEALENRIATTEDSRSEGLQFLLMAKQHQVRGEDASALRMYRMALPFFPGNEKLADRMLALQRKLAGSQDAGRRGDDDNEGCDEDDEYRYEGVDDDEDATDELSFKKPQARQRGSKVKHKRLAVLSDADDTLPIGQGSLTPRTKHLLQVINSRDIAQIRSLKGVGAKKAEAIVDKLCEMGEEDLTLSGLERLGAGRGVGVKSLETMRKGVAI